MASAPVQRPLRRCEATGPGGVASLPVAFHRCPSTRNLQRHGNRAAAEPGRLRYRPPHAAAPVTPSPSPLRPSGRGSMSRRTPSSRRRPATNGLLVWTSRRMRGRTRLTGPGRLTQLETEAQVAPVLTALRCTWPRSPRLRGFGSPLPSSKTCAAPGEAREAGATRPGPGAPVRGIRVRSTLQVPRPRNRRKFAGTGRADARWSGTRRVFNAQRHDDGLSHSGAARRERSRRRKHCAGGC